jgi:hypothetical protein
MNYDLNILWIEDTTSWLDTAKEFFLLNVEEQDGLLINIDSVSSSDEVDSLSDSIERESKGFKLYDIIFVDFNISNEINGADLIEKFRNSNIDADILFYSDKLKTDKQKETMKEYEFSGIYLSTKELFQEKAIKLYNKNVRRLTSMLNIRGLLTDKTSENDYTMKSFLMQEYDKLSDDAKSIISEQINNMLRNEIASAKKKITSAESILNQKVHNMNKLHNLPDFIFPIINRYAVFYELLNKMNIDAAKKYSLEDYNGKIIKTRNAVAHKKLDICKQQKYLKYYDTLKQYKARTCPVDCALHTDDNKISLDQWKETLKLANEYSKFFESILKGLEAKS